MVRLSLHSTATVTARELFDLCDRYAVVVALNAVLERRCRNCKADSTLAILARKERVYKSCAEAVAFVSILFWRSLCQHMAIAEFHPNTYIKISLIYIFVLLVSANRRILYYTD